MNYEEYEKELMDLFDKKIIKKDEITHKEIFICLI